MKKRYCEIALILLLIWFFLDMTGLYIGGKCLVTRSYKEDGIFFIIYMLVVALFIFKEKIGKWAAAIGLSIWFLVEFLCHEWYTLFNRGIIGNVEGKIRYFRDTIKWIQIEGRYIPDLYHIVEHILIVVALVSTVSYIIKNRNKV